MRSNYAGGASGALAGAGTGAALGSIVPGIGTGIGAAGGALIGGLSGLFSGGKDKVRQIPTQTKEQQEYLKNVLGQLQQGGIGQNYGQANDYLSQMLSGDPEAYARFAAPHMTQFEQQTVPMLAERFAGMTGPFGKPTDSSGFGQALSGAGGQLQSNLAGLYAQLQQQAAQQALGQYNYLSGLGLGTQAFQPMYQPGTPGFGPTALSGILEGTGKGFGQAAGNTLSSRFADMFGNKNSTNPESQPGYTTGIF